MRLWSLCDTKYFVYWPLMWSYKPTEKTWRVISDHSFRRLVRRHIKCPIQFPFKPNKRKFSMGVINVFFRMKNSDQKIEQFFQKRLFLIYWVRTAEVDGSRLRSKRIFSAPRRYHRYKFTWLKIGRVSRYSGRSFRSSASLQERA